MLIKNAVNTASMLANYYADRGVLLQALPDTPLAEAAMASLVTYDVRSQEDNFEPAEALVEGSMFTDPTGYNHHDKVMEEAVAAVSGALAYNLNLARNVVNPLMDTLAKEIIASMGEATEVALSPLSIRSFHWPEIYNSPVLLDYVSRYATNTPADVELKMLGLPCPDDLVGALATGAGRFDDDVAAFAQTLGEGEIAAVWDALFGRGAHRTLSGLLGYSPQNINTPVIAYLLANRAFNEIPEGVNLSVSEWKVYTSALMARAGNAIMRNLNIRSTEARAGVLVISAPPVGDLTTGEIVVNGDVYRNWLNEGGTPEILFAAFYNNEALDYTSLLKSADRLNASWKTIHAMIQGRAVAGRFDAMVSGMRTAMTRVINDLTEEELEGRDRSALHQALKARLARVQARDLDDIFYAVRKTICRVLYPHTDVEAMLSSIDAACIANPDMDKREAALLATIDFVAVWLSKLIVKQKVG